MKKLIKNDLGFYEKLAGNQLSIIPIREIENGHKPNLDKWGKYQEELVTPNILSEWYNDANTVSFGLVTGFSDVEAIDIDSKILPTKKERDEFLKEYFTLLIIT